MRVVVPVEARYVRTPDGRVWSHTPPVRTFWDRYLAVFDEVRVVARVLDVDRPPAGALRVDGDGVHVWAVPYYVGPGQYLTRWRSVRRAVRHAAADGDAVIVRAPSPIGTPLAAHRRRRGRPYALEVVGDPAEVFAPGVTGHPLRPLFRPWFTATLRRQCHGAAAVAYVTERVLQATYPPGPHAFTASYSSVELGSSAFVSAPRGRPDRTGARLVSVGTLEQPYKGIDVLIEAVARLRADGWPVAYVHVGEGRLRPYLQALARRLGVGDVVEFVGALPTGRPVWDRLDAADLFVLPSRTEGQGRALIEAMARGLPAVASAVGGIVELLDRRYLVPAGDPARLAARIASVLRDPAGMAAASAANLARARGFATASLTPRRTAFYRVVREATEESTRGRAGHAVGGLPARIRA
jgi:glycosyltransferase involved in cell wall biosynthesis